MFALRNPPTLRAFGGEDQFPDPKKNTIIWVFPKIVVPQNGWFIMENPIKMDEFGGKTHYFRKHPFLKKVTTTTTWRLGWVSPLSHRSKLQPRICSKSKPSGPAPTPPQPVGRFLGKFFNARFLWSEKNGRDFWVLPIEMTRR